ncbi:MAG TPA: AtpZ/AtpI family protein [Anaerolineales bacterium]|nr:AtpZ/AtpI family protein [Anaerolineales bacterium]
MSQTGETPDRDRTLRSLNLTLALVTGQVGCLTIVIIFAALFIGRWLDTQFGSSPLFTIVLMVGSVPITLILMFWVVKSVTARYSPKAGPPTRNSQEGVDRGES